MLESLGKLINNKILAIYRCGSSIYGLATTESDEDYTVIVEGDFLPNIIKDDERDYFVFGVAQFKEALSFKNGYLSCFLVWLDNVTIAKENLVYIDDSFKEEFDELIGVDWNKYFHPWLKKNISYFDIRLENSPEDKCLYSLFRLNSIVKRYQKDGVFLSCFSEEDKAKAEEFKNNPSSRDKFKEELNEILNYLNSFIKEE